MRLSCSNTCIRFPLPPPYGKRVKLTLWQKRVKLTLWQKRVKLTLWQEGQTHPMARGSNSSACHSRHSVMSPALQLSLPLPLALPPPTKWSHFSFLTAVLVLLLPMSFPLISTGSHPAYPPQDPSKALSPQGTMPTRSVRIELFLF